MFSVERTWNWLWQKFLAKAIHVPSNAIVECTFRFANLPNDNILADILKKWLLAFLAENTIT